MTSDGQEPTRNSCLMSGRRLRSFSDLAVELLMGVGHAGQIALLQDRGAEAGLGEDHDAGGGLQEMRAGARAYHEEKRVLHLAVQPDDAGEAAEHLPLAAFLQDGGVLAASGGDGGRTVHVVASASRRATRSFQRNCPALIT
jgi:hypothetical protein